MPGDPEIQEPGRLPVRWFHHRGDCRRWPSPCPAPGDRAPSGARTNRQAGHSPSLGHCPYPAGHLVERGIEDFCFLLGGCPTGPGCSCAGGRLWARCRPLSSRHQLRWPRRREREASGKVKCRVKNAHLPRSARVFHCDSCGLVIDKDLNAAKNLAALAELACACLMAQLTTGQPVDWSTLLVRPAGWEKDQDTRSSRGCPSRRPKGQWRGEQDRPGTFCWGLLL